MVRSPVLRLFLDPTNCVRVNIRLYCVASGIVCICITYNKQILGGNFAPFSIDHTASSIGALYQKSI